MRNKALDWSLLEFCDIPDKNCADNDQRATRCKQNSPDIKINKL